MCTVLAGRLLSLTFCPVLPPLWWSLAGLHVWHVPTFHLRGGGDTPVLYRVSHGREQLVLPATGGFRQLVLSELHDSKLGGHLDATRTLAALM